MTLPHVQLWFGSSDGGDAGHDIARVRRLRIVTNDDALSAEHGDCEWLDALRAGDAAAFKQLYLEHSPGLWEFTAYLSRDADVARDIVQDVFVSLWERRETIEIRETLRVYLFRAVRNQVSKWFRHEQIERRAEAEYEDVGVAMGEAAPNPESTLDAATLEAAVDAIVQAMPPARRTAAVLRLRHGLSDEEAAGVMGISIDAVRMHVSRARAALRPLIARYKES
jgi:RNA polymerase sigma-70 factor (family 1)